MNRLVIVGVKKSNHNKGVVAYRYGKHEMKHYFPYVSRVGMDQGIVD